MLCYVISYYSILHVISVCYICCLYYVISACIIPLSGTSPRWSESTRSEPQRTARGRLRQSIPACRLLSEFVFRTLAPRSCTFLWLKRRQVSGTLTNSASLEVSHGKSSWSESCHRGKTVRRFRGLSRRWGQAQFRRGSRIRSPGPHAGAPRRQDGPIRGLSQG